MLFKTILKSNLGINLSEEMEHLHNNNLKTMKKLIEDIPKK